MPVASPGVGHQFGDHRLVVVGIIWRYRTGEPWRDVPIEFGPWQTIGKRCDRFRRKGTCKWWGCGQSRPTSHRPC